MPNKKAHEDVGNGELMRLTVIITELRDAVAGLARAVVTRPTRNEAAHKRRVNAVLLLVFAMSLIMIHDQHIERCGPGARSEATLNYVVARDLRVSDLAPDEVRDINRAPIACDITFPLHAHQYEWPTSYNIVGLVFYGILGLALFIYARGPKDWKLGRRTSDYIPSVKPPVLPAHPTRRKEDDHE